MIESKILGSAAGIQRQDVIDNSETTVLPSLDKGVIVGRFKRGRMDKAFMVTAINYQSLLGYDPSNASYLVVEDAFKRGVSQVPIMRIGSSSAGTGLVAAGTLGFLKLNNDTSINYLDGNIGGLVYSINGGEIKVVEGDLPPPTETRDFSKSMFWFFDADDLFASFSVEGDDGFEGTPEDMPVGLDIDKFYLWGMDETVLAEDYASYGMPVPNGVKVETVTLTLYPASKKPDSNIDYDIFDLIIDPSTYTESEKQHFSERGITPAVKNRDGSYTLNSQVITPAFVPSVEPTSGVRIRTQNPNVSRFDVLYEYHPENIGNGGENNLNVGNLWADSAYDSQEKTAKIRINNDGWSDWSDPIIFDDVNHPNSVGYLGVSFNTQKSPNFAMDMDGIADSADFAWNLLVKLNSFGVFEYRNFGGELSVATPIETPNPPNPAPSNLVPIPTDSLVHYAFNGDYSDSSDNNVSATTDGLMAFADGRKAGTQSLQFSDGKILTDPLAFNSNKLTLSFWVKGSQDVPASVFRMAGADGFQFLYNDQYQSYDLTNVDKDERMQSVGTDRMAYNDKWTFVVCMIDRSIDVGLIIHADDEPIGTKEWSPKPIGDFATSPLLIGRYDDERFMFEGFLQDVRLYNRILTADEMTALYYE